MGNELTGLHLWVFIPISSFGGDTLAMKTREEPGPAGVVLPRGPLARIGDRVRTAPGTSHTYPPACRLRCPVVTLQTGRQAQLCPIYASCPPVAVVPADRPALLSLPVVAM